MNQSAAAQEHGKKIRVLAADSTRMSSQLLAEALAQDTQFDVTGIDTKATSVIDAVAEQKPHVVLLSASFNGSATAGFEITRKVRDAAPDTKIILMMDAANPAAVVEAFRSGAQGIFSRSESSKALAKCITSVHQGQVWANSSELRYLLQALREAAPVRLVDSRGDAILSKREHDVVQCVAEGLSNREIASRLKLTEHTVKNYLFRIFDKLGVSSRVEVVLYAFSVRGIVCEPLVSDPRSSERNSSQRRSLQSTTEVAKARSADAKKPAEPAKPLAHRARM
jgi:two-component system nitrate/nitrite response regulator NarL